jgi:hypothetical protein
LKAADEIMFTALLMGALGAAALIQQTDTILNADGATRLHLQAQRGEVVVRTWDRDAVHVRAAHAPDRELHVDRSGRTLRVRVDGQRVRGQEDAPGRRFGGSPLDPVDFELTLPRGFDLDLEGMALRVDIQDTGGSVEVTTVQGPIVVRGARGNLTLETVSGQITVEEAQGNLRVNAVAGTITVSNASGAISAETVGGSVTLEGIASGQVEARTVSGPLRYEGSIREGGRYTFGTHAGDVWLRLPSDMGARVSAVTLAGEIRSDFPAAPDIATRRQGIPGLQEKRLTFETGDGSARVSVETFAGTIHVLRR